MTSKGRLRGSIALSALLAAGCGGTEEPAPKPAEKSQPSAPASGTEAVLEHHLASFNALDMDATLADYAPDAVFISPLGTVRGTDGIKAVFEEMMAEFGQPGTSFEILKQIIEGDIAYIIWKAETADNLYEFGTDTFLIRDGKILQQTLALKATPKGETPPEKPAGDQEAGSGPPEGPTASVLKHHLDAFGAQDLEGVLSDYTDESILITPDGTIRGREGLKALFEGMMAEFGQPGSSFEMAKTVIDGELAYILWSAETANNVYELGTDTFFVRDGKIAVQTLAVKVTPKES